MFPLLLLLDCSVFDLYFSLNWACAAVAIIPKKNETHTHINERKLKWGKIKRFCALNCKSDAQESGANSFYNGFYKHLYRECVVCAWIWERIWIRLYGLYGISVSTKPWRFCIVWINVEWVSSRRERKTEYGKNNTYIDGEWKKKI